MSFTSAISQAHDQREKFFTAPLVATQGTITGHGLAGQTEVNDAGALLRSAFGSFRVEPWISSPYYPDAPNSHSFAIVGYTTASHAPLGVLAFYRSVKAAAKADEVGDWKGHRLAILSAGMTVAKTGLGLGAGVLRTATIGTVLNPQAPVFANLSSTAGLVGNICASLYYGGFAAIDLGSVDHSFAQKYQEKGDAEYMRRRLGLNEDALEEKALKGKTSEDLKKAGMKRLLEFAKVNMELLRKAGHDPEVSSEEEFVHRFLGPEEIEEAGKDALIGNLQEKKNDKMTRAIGEEGVSALKKLLKGDRKVEKPEVDKIVLSSLSKVTSSRYFRAAYCIAGFVAMICLCIFTSGAPLIIATAFFTLVAIIEAVTSFKSLCDEKNKRETAPGEYDKVIPSIGIAATLAGTTAQIVIASVLSMGIAPIVLGLVLSVVYLGLYSYHIYTIDQRRQEHGQFLLNEKEGDLSLEEFEYLCTYMSDETLAFNSPLKRMGYKERNELDKFMQGPAVKDKNWRELLLYALAARKLQIEKEYVEEFWEQYQQRVSLEKIAI